MAGPELETVRSVTQRHPALDLLLLYGSRATGDAHAGSDWDFGYIADGSFDAAALVGDLVLALGTDHVDLVDLSYASGLLRYRAARDGIICFARTPEADFSFRFEATRFWCEAAPVIERGYESTLAGLVP